MGPEPVLMPNFFQTVINSKNAAFIYPGLGPVRFATFTRAELLITISNNLKSLNQQANRLNEYNDVSWVITSGIQVLGYNSSGV